MEQPPSPSLAELSDDLLTLILTRLHAATWCVAVLGWSLACSRPQCSKPLLLPCRCRRAVAPTCRRWERILCTLQTALVLTNPASHAAQAALLPAVSKRALTRLHCTGEGAADGEWLAFLCGLLAGSLRRLHLQGQLRQGLPWLGGLQKLQVSPPARCLLPAALQRRHHPTCGSPSL